MIQAFHATRKSAPWVQCNNTISDQMWSPTSRPSIELLPGILEEGVEILFFAGELDMMCNALGVERSIDALKWRGATGMARSSSFPNFSTMWRAARRATLQYGIGM